MSLLRNLTVYRYAAGGSLAFDVTIPATQSGSTIVVCFVSSAGNFWNFDVPIFNDDVSNTYALEIASRGIALIYACENATGGVATIHVTNAFIVCDVYVFELMPTVQLDAQETDYRSGADDFPNAAGPTLNGVGDASFFINAIGLEPTNEDPSDNDITSVDSGWTLSSNAGNPVDLFHSIATGVGYFEAAAGPQTATFSFQRACKGASIAGIVFQGSDTPPPPPPTPPPCAPVDPQGHLTAGVLIDDLDLFIGPATALYDTYLNPPQIADYETGAEGRREIVLDFNNSDGVYARDLGTAFSWPLITQGKPKTVLFAWQPSVIPMPEGVYGRATDWMDGGTAGTKYIQGIMVEGDSFGNAKSFVLQDSDTLQFHSLNELPAIFTKQTVKAFSCLVPFVAHSARLIANDGVEWRVWQTSLVFEPWPELCRNWQAEMTSLELTGWGHVREMNIPHVSTADLTLVLTFDSWPTIILTIPNSGGRQVKQKVTLPANKFKLMQPRIYSTEDFRLFEKDLELKIKSWGSYDFYRISKPFGGPSREGALV